MGILPKHMCTNSASGGPIREFYSGQENVIEKDITKLPKEESSDMLLHDCPLLITKTDPGTTQTAESLTQSQHSATAA